MKKNKLKFYIYTLAVLVSSYIFIGGDCSTNNDDELPPSDNLVAAPGSFTFKIEAEAGGDSKITFNWTSSSDENDTDFEGYRIITVKVDSNNHVTSIFQEQALNKNLKTHSINPLDRGTRFKTFLLAEKNNGIKSDSLETEVYAAVFYNTNGEIDSHENSSSWSGFGWNVENGEGIRYPYSQSNAGKIDLHVRELGDVPYFFSPGGLDPGFKLTRMKNVGSGQSAFDETDLPEADETFLAANPGDVYLIKTQEEYYVKVWIKDITPPSDTQSYYTITFDYKVQPIENLRIL